MSTITNKIDSVETTNLDMSGRAGLALYLRYLEKSGMSDMLSEALSFLSKNKKGLSVESFITQMGAYFMDGTNHRISQFNQLKFDASYAKTLGLTQEELASSASISRFFDKFNVGNCNKFNPILNLVFKKVVTDFTDDKIIITLDSMVLDNDESNHKQGCTPTYKKKKGLCMDHARKKQK